jgi:putative redox protein
MAYDVQIRLLRADEPAPQLEPPNFIYQHPRGGRFEYRVNGLSGGHLLHLAVAGCLFNGIVRVAHERGIALSHALVRADGGFNDEGTRSTGISYRMEVEGDASQDELIDLAAFVQQDSSVPQIVTHGAPVAAADVVVTASRKT